MLRSEGLGVPLGALEGLEVPLGGLGVLLGGSGGLVAAKLQNSLSAQNRIIRSNLKNTVKYVINTIRRIIRLRRMTHPCIYTYRRNMYSFRTPQKKIYFYPVRTNPHPSQYII